MSSTVEVFLRQSLDELRRNGKLAPRPVVPQRGQVMLPLESAARTYDMRLFHWSQMARAMTEAITRQVLARWDELSWKSVFADYVTQGAWYGCYLSAFGKTFDNLRRLPLVAQLLSEIPSAVESGPCVLSLLERDTVLKPHYGMTNGRLICHLPLLAPRGCILTVNGENLEFEPGSPVAFDDTYLHSVRVSSSGPRLALIFSVSHPELSVGERELFQTLLDEMKIPERYLMNLSLAADVRTPLLEQREHSTERLPVG